MNVIKIRKPAIPEAYTQVEWVKSDGTGEIDLGKQYPNNHSSFKISMKYDVDTTSDVIFGAQYNVSNPLIVAYNGSLYCSGDTASDNRIKTSVFPKGVHTFECEMKNQTVTYSRDNATPVSYSVAPYSPTKYGSKDTVLVLAYRLSPNNIRRCTAAMYYFKMEFDGIVFCDLIPVKRISDNVVGMYDLTTKTFFSIPGTCGRPVATPLMEDTYYGDIRYPKSYVKYHSNDQANYPDVLEDYDIITDISTGTWVKASGGYFYKDLSPTGFYNIYCTMFSTKSGVSTPRITHGSGRMYLYNVPYETTTEVKEAIAGLDILTLMASDGQTWVFVKRTSDNKFGYYCEKLNTFFELNTEAGGAVADDLYDHFMLKGGDD